MRKLILKGSEWLRGEEPSFLVRASDDKKCCMGIEAVDRGIDPNKLCGVTMPRKLRWMGDPLMTQYAADWNKDALAIAAINDAVTWSEVHRYGIGRDKDRDAKVTDEERIGLLRPYFLSHGIELEFRPDE